MNGPFRIKGKTESFQKYFQAKSKRYRGMAGEVQARAARRIGYMTNKIGQEIKLIERKFQTLKMLVEIERTGRNPASRKPLGWPARLKNMRRAIRMYEELMPNLKRQGDAIERVEKAGQAIFTDFKPTVRGKPKRFALEMRLHQMYKTIEYYLQMPDIHSISESVETFRKRLEAEERLKT